MRLELLEEVHESWLKGEEVVLNVDTIRSQSAPSTAAADEASTAIDEDDVLLTGIVGETVCNSVLICGHIVDEPEVEVRPDVLPSALLDYRVKLPSLKKFFTEDAWTLLMASGAVLESVVQMQS
ncbi:hypothetical protein MTO96_039969 [Rhipicephalus appendiculatus]